MELHLPRAASLFDMVLREVHDGSTSDHVVDDVSAEQLHTAIAALTRGDVEYLGLHEGGAFVQVAGEGAGPYLLELHPAPGTGEPVHVPTGVTAEAVAFALDAYLGRDPGWAQPFAWEPLDAPTPPRERGGMLGRLFKRS